MQDSVSRQFLSDNTKDSAKDVLARAISMGTDFKLQESTRLQEMTAEAQDSILNEPIPVKASSPEEVLEDFSKRVLPYCYNFSSPQFMGFPDAGNSIAAITGAVIGDLMQQNLINQSFCSPSGTFVEMAVIGWLREVVGYNKTQVHDVFGAGGIITGGGTTSNAVAMLLAREQHCPGTMTDGVNPSTKGVIIVPKGIGHYSVKSAQMWIGNGMAIVEVDTDDFRYDQKSLRQAVLKHKGNVNAIVAYVGDSRTMTIDNLEEIADLRDEVDPSIWLHADACHGFSLGFSNKLRHMIKGIERFDSITTDPHKVMNIPYTVSALLLKDPQKIKTVSSMSDLIMQEQFAWGQVTPFVGSKPWMSLKVWFALKSIGIEGYGKIVEQRHDMALALQDLVNRSDDFIMINSVQINSVAFMYIGSHDKTDIEGLNLLNKAIHDRIIDDGIYHLHQFSIYDRGIIRKGETIYPLRYMSGNPLTTKRHLTKMLDYIRLIAAEVQSD